MEVISEAVHSPVKHEAPDQEDGQHHVGHGGGDPDHLAAGLDPLEEGDVEEAVDRGDAENQLPLRRAQLINTRAVLHPQHPQAEAIKGLVSLSNYFIKILLEIFFCRWSCFIA